MHKLNTYDHSWEFIDSCPCDQHFIELITEYNLSGLSIFHFGSGNHHLVGKSPDNIKRSNVVLSITASRAEYLSYIDLVTTTPSIASHYHLLFGDIYLLNANFLPMLDVVTLFHLGEYWKQSTLDYGGMTDSDLLEMFYLKIKVNGMVMFFKNSNAFQRVLPLIEDWCARHNMKVVGEYKS